MGTKLILTLVPVTVASGAATGASAANPLLANTPSRIIGIVPTGLVTSTGWGLVETVTMALATGVVTVTTRANVATADLTVNVIVATIANG